MEVSELRAALPGQDEVASDGSARKVRFQCRLDRFGFNQEDGDQQLHVQPTSLAQIWVVLRACKHVSNLTQPARADHMSVCCNLARSGRHAGTGEDTAAGSWQLSTIWV